ncbi:MAG TPA: copper-containing nitrite reductase [Opitutaceae bacterium]|nr:copper-containing nitrite reductase [Opitutaceae bacterium]
MKKFSRLLAAAALIAVALSSQAARAAAESETTASSPPGSGIPANLPIEHAVLTQAPNVPPPITRKTPAHVIVTIEVKEVTRRLADNVDYWFWTFGGDVPGNFIRVREGDYIEFHLNNHPSSKLPHNIDLHAVTGPGGGATSSFTAPGHGSQFSFQAINPGLFLYHCATAPVPMHVANGMYGLILVEPKDGMPHVDREYYVMQSEVYTTGRYGETGLQGFDQTKAVDENPPYVIFNGSVGALTGDKTLSAKVGETVRLYLGNAGPNLVSSFHLIGEIFDNVYVEGGTSAVQHNVQTTLIPAGGTSVVDFHLDVPGTYILADHSLFRAFNKGALGMLKVTGPENHGIYSGKEVDAVYLGAAAPEATAAGRREATLQAQIDAEMKSNPKIAGLTKEAQISRGKQIFMSSCFACHQPDGMGLPGVFPPLAKSDFLMANRERAIRVLWKGLSGPVTVNGKEYNSSMPPQELTEQQAADVLTFVTNSFGNSAEPFTVDEIRKVHQDTSPH